MYKVIFTQFQNRYGLILKASTRMCSSSHVLMPMFQPYVTWFHGSFGGNLLLINEPNLIEQDQKMFPGYESIYCNFNHEIWMLESCFVIKSNAKNKKNKKK